MRMTIKGTLEQQRRRGELMRRLHGALEDAPDSEALAALVSYAVQRCVCSARSAEAAAETMEAWAVWAGRTGAPLAADAWRAIVGGSTAGGDGAPPGRRREGARKAAADTLN